MNSVEWGTTAARFASQLARNKSLYTEFDFNLLTMGKKCTRDFTDNSAARFASQLARNKSLYTEFDFNLLTMGKKCTRDFTDNSPRTYLYIKKEMKVLSERSTALPTDQLLLSL